MLLHRFDIRQALLIKIIVHDVWLTGIYEMSVRKSFVDKGKRLQQVVKAFFLHPATGKADQQFIIQS